MTLLHPQDRALYTEALTTPTGFRFDQAVALTYSLDLDTLLAVPLHLLLYATGNPQPELLKDHLRLLDALRQTANRLSVFHQRGRILLPRGQRVLYSLLEDSVFHATTPNGGAFHPKVWVLRFTPRHGEAPLIRLVVLSRNLTADLSWDVSLTAEGRPGSTPIAGNSDLVRLLRHLPDLAAGISNDRRSQLDTLASELATTRWELPEGIETLRLHTLGLGRNGWMPPPSARLLIISPFCSKRALEKLSETSDSAPVLISRPEELAGIPEATRDRFRPCLTLREEAEAKDGEEPRERWGEHRGLHAKFYLCDEAERSRVIMGSANATNAALVRGANLEVLAEIVGSRKSLGSVNALLAAEGFRALFEEFDSTSVTTPGGDELAARQALDDAHTTLSQADLVLRCREEDNRWHLDLRARYPFKIQDDLRIIAWPITISRARWLSCAPLLDDKRVVFGPMDVSSITRFIAFEIAFEDKCHESQACAFVRRLPIEGLPGAEREAAVVHQVVRNREGFLRYLLFLLGTFDAFAETGSGAGLARWRSSGGRGFETLPLLEEMTRALCRDPARLESVRLLIENLREGNSRGESDEIVPESFLKLWATFESALSEPRDRMEKEH